MERIHNAKRDTRFDDFLELDAASCPKMHSLSVRKTHGKITDKSFKLLATKCPDLKWLAVGQSNGKITKASLSLLKPWCEVEK